MTPAWAMADSAPAGIGLGGLLAISIVLALVGSLAWLLRRGVLKLPGRRRDQRVSVETAVSLGDRRSLVIVAVEGRRLLLGVTPAQVSLVTELQGFEARLDSQLGGPSERSAA